MIAKLRTGHYVAATNTSSVRLYEVDAYITLDVSGNKKGNVVAVYSKSIPKEHVIEAMRELQLIPYPPFKTLERFGYAYVASPNGLVDCADTTYGRYTEKEIK